MLSTRWPCAYCVADAGAEGGPPAQLREPQGERAMSSGNTRTDPLYTSVRTTVETALRDVVGDWYYEECQIGLDSTFAEDIQLESMEVMEVAEKLMDAYEGRVDFVAWFADMELEVLVELTVGHIVDFIVTSLESSEGQAVGAVGA
jgi:acyl carrier protein